MAVVIAFGTVLPMALWLRGNPAVAPKLFIAIGFLPFLLKVFPGLDIALLSWPDHPGFTHGLEVTAIDILGLMLFAAFPQGRRQTPFLLVFAFYFVAVLLSVGQAQVPLAASFYAWQFARVFLLFAVVAQACTDRRIPGALLKGMALGLCLQAAVVLWQRYGLGQIQAHGTFVHQNTLGMVANLVVLPHFALLLAGSGGWPPLVVPLAGAIVAVFTTSRATVALSGAGLALTYLVLSFHRWTARKGVIALAGLIGLAGLTPVVVSSFEQRFAAIPLSRDYGEREAFERAAALILDDHPFGVGANHYVMVARDQGYSEQAGVIRAELSRNAHVHNAYWLAAAETGYLGITALALLLLRPLSVAFVCGWRNKTDIRGALLLGLGCALLIVYVHSFVEWIFFTTQVQYLFAIVVGMVAGLAQQLGYWLPRTYARRRRARPSDGRLASRRATSVLPTI